MEHTQREEHIKFGRQIYSYLVLGTINDNEGVIRGINYKFEHLGQTLDGHWTILRVFNVHNKDERIFSNAIMDTLVLLVSELGILDKWVVDKIAYLWDYGKCIPYMDVRVRFVESEERETTTEGKTIKTATPLD